MKKYFSISLVFIIVMYAAVSCTKDKAGPAVGPGVTSLTIANAIPNSSPIIANINNQLPYYKGQPGVSFGNYLLYRFTGGPTGISLRQSTDTSVSLTNFSNLDLSNNTLHSLFVSGTASSPDSLLVEDILPYHGGGHGITDSAAGIRFVNLSGGSSPISINLDGAANGSEVSNLGYREITDFRDYPATAAISNYVFEFRDAVTGNLLATYTFTGVNNGNINNNTNSFRFKNFTLAFIGFPGSQSAIGINNY